MATGNLRHRCAGRVTFLDDAQLLLCSPPPAPSWPSDDLDALILVLRHKPVPRVMPRPPCLRRVSGQNGGQFRKVKHLTGWGIVPVLGERNPSDDDASVEVGTFPPSFKGSPFSLVCGSMGQAKAAPAGGEHGRSARRAARPDKAAIPPKADKPPASEPRCSGHVPASLADVSRRFSNDATSQ